MVAKDLIGNIYQVVAASDGRLLLEEYNHMEETNRFVLVLAEAGGEAFQDDTGFLKFSELKGKK